MLKCWSPEDIVNLVDHHGVSLVILVLLTVLCLPLACDCIRFRLTWLLFYLLLRSGLIFLLFHSCEQNASENCVLDSNVFNPCDWGTRWWWPSFRGRRLGLRQLLINHMYWVLTFPTSLVTQKKFCSASVLSAEGGSFKVNTVLFIAHVIGHAPSY